ncbi:Arm DNA-binding domain-containing protein [Aliivibrio finisterrensis]|uniref:DUF3596 domain-containing protein n=1 Tax=Aliivibrio finisterrensis TaxID=511998 RepID=A0A6N6RW37_9GAMM|nr:DUF3596 domain-containing protein [Aliivibrio finisterrensis]KAB2825925.1 DUF3596 domain-containing protein [Aliivibrio finisterrensis]
MGVVNVRNGKLVIQFRFKGQRCREQTQLLDNSVNRKRLDRMLQRIEAEIILDAFDYQNIFQTALGYHQVLKKVKSGDNLQFNVNALCGQTSSLTLELRDS